MNIPDTYWSTEPPTKPGNYSWRQTSTSRPILVEVCECPDTGGMRAYSFEHEGDFVTHPFFGGFWCRLVPAEEVAEAFKEGAEAIAKSSGHTTKGMGDWHWRNSKARKVMEGEV